MANYPLSLHHLTMLPAHPLQLIDAAIAGDFDYFGLRIVAPTEADTIVEVTTHPALVREIEARLANEKLKLLDIEAVWLRPTTKVDSLLPALDVAQRLGAQHVLVVGHDDDTNRLADNFARLCEMAARHQLTVALEFITYCAIGSLAAAQRLIEQSGRTDTLLLVDALQFFRSGATPAALKAIPAHRLRYLQICDGPAQGPTSIDERRREARTNRQLPGEGELPLSALLQAMPEDIILSVEAPTLKLHGLPFEQQARIVAEATRCFLQTLPE